MCTDSDDSKKRRSSVTRDVSVMENCLTRSMNLYLNSEATPDYVWLEWKKSDEVHLTDIKMYKLVINGETKVILPSEETRYVFSDGDVGEKYIFQIEVS